MSLLEAHHRPTMSDDEVRPSANFGMATAPEVLSNTELLGGTVRRDADSAFGDSPAGSVRRVLACHGALVDNWDGHGSISPNRSAIRNAELLVRSLPNGAVPAITASVTGGVLLEWESSDVALILEIPNTGHVEAFVSWPSGREIEGPLTSLKQYVLDALAALLVAS